MTTHRAKILVKPLVFFTSTIPFLYLFFAATGGHLGADPQLRLLHSLGLWSLKFLLLTLSLSSLTFILRMPVFVQQRRMLGLFAWFYASLHILAYLAFNLGFSFAILLEETIKRPYILVGALAFVLLSALALTSTKKIQRRMGKWWKHLHRANYVLTLLVLVHFLWSVKLVITEPLLYFFGFLAIMMVRFARAKRWLKPLAN